jgi:hypothetical protein
MLSSVSWSEKRQACHRSLNFQRCRPSATPTPLGILIVGCLELGEVLGDLPDAEEAGKASDREPAARAPSLGPGGRPRGAQ